jgi:carbonic anhydrase
MTGLRTGKPSPAYATRSEGRSESPCTEGLTWYLSLHPISRSAQQIDVFAKLYPDNARPIQPTNGREILLSPGLADPPGPIY